MKNKSVIRQAAEIIKKGGIVAFPTETVYGLGADAFNPLAVARVFEVKGRPSFDPLIIHVAHPQDVERLVREIPTPAETLMKRFWPGPLTVVLNKREEVPDLVTAGLPTVAIRMPRHPMTLALIDQSGAPVLPSDHPTQSLAPYTLGPAPYRRRSK